VTESNDGLLRRISISFSVHPARAYRPYSPISQGTSSANPTLRYTALGFRVRCLLHPPCL
jgi:hypothetical protein